MMPRVISIELGRETSHWSNFGALSPNLAIEITAGKSTGQAERSLLATYRFSGNLPFRRLEKISFRLNMDSSIPDALRDGVLNLNGKSWLTSRGDVSDLIQALQMGKNFFMRVV